MKKLLLFLAFLLFTPTTFAGVTAGNTSSSYNDQGGTTRTWTHNNNGSVLVVPIEYNPQDTGAVVSITFNGDSLTEARSDVGSFMASAVWYLDSPDQGSYSIVMTMTSSAFNKGGSAISLIDAGTLNATGGSSCSITTSVSSSATFPTDGITVDSFGLKGAVSSTGNGSNQTTIADNGNATGYPASGAHSSYNTTNGSMSWTSASNWLCHTVATFTFSPPATVPKTMGVESANIASIMGVASANITTVMGIEV